MGDRADQVAMSRQMMSTSSRSTSKLRLDQLPPWRWTAMSYLNARPITSPTRQVQLTREVDTDFRVASEVKETDDQVVIGPVCPSQLVEVS